MSPTPHRTKRVLLGLVSALVVLGAALVTDRVATQAQRTRITEEAAQRARASGETAREALTLQTEAMALTTENAAANPRFLAALRGRVDRQTFADLLATESWWETYRRYLAAISYDGATLAFAQTEGAEGLPIGVLMREVGTTGKSAARAMAGAKGVFLVAATPVSLGAGRNPAVLLLARLVDQPLLDGLARRTRGPLLLGDGVHALGAAGEGAAVLGPLLGRERAGEIALADPTARAAVVELAPGVWLWTLGRAAELEQAAMETERSRRATLWAVAVPLAFVIGVWSLRPARRRVDPGRTSASHPTAFGVSVSSGSSAFDEAATAVAPMAPGSGRPLGRYMLVDQIGEGGMAEVYSAVSFGYGGFRRSFVIKRLRAELNGNATAVDLFIDEANLASTLVHPNVVPVFDFGEAAGSYYLAQEYVVGRDLGRITRRIRERGEPLLSVNAILYVASELLGGLTYAHDKRDDAGNPLGLVHRDITPENVMISDRGEVKITDFGIMKAKQRVSQTESGTVKGSVGFMSPEQARGRFVDHRSDLFSVGMVMLYAASGQPLYQGDTFYDLLTAAATGPTDEHRARIAALAEPLPAILLRALDVDPDRRF
jgi:hypothetical protein